LWLAPYVSGLALVNVMAMRQVALAGVEPSWALWLLLAIALPRASGLFGGLAAAARQTAWLYLPFVALDRLRAGRTHAIRWAAIAAAVFLELNLPFALPAPEAWLSGATSPLIAPYEPLGFGIVRFSTDGPLPLAPRAAYTVAMLGAYALALVAWWRDRRGWRYGLATLPVAPLYLGWRSLQNYFMFAPLFLVALVGEDPEEPRANRIGERETGPRPLDISKTGEWQGLRSPSERSTTSSAASTPATPRSPTLTL
jgi:uncharacterized membrane protein